MTVGAGCGVGVGEGPLGATTVLRRVTWCLNQVRRTSVVQDYHRHTTM